MSATSATTVSAPGKVLLAGGYLVLDPAYSGVVVSTSARFYTSVRNTQALPGAHGDRPIEIRVRSPQFLDATWIYFVHFEPDGVHVQQVADASGSTTSNKFVHLAIDRTLTLVWQLMGPGGMQNSLSYGLDITIAGDNDFYSQRAQLAARNLPPTLASLSQLPPFAPQRVRLPDVHKTGLGSSAALITSLVSALLVHFGVVPRAALQGAGDPGDPGRRTAHNVAQYVHCLAQGKVGSGFDVAAAVFGSQLYTRFAPSVLAPLMDGAASGAIAEAVAPTNPAWDYRVAPFQLPPLTRLMLADVDAGSDTPSLVGKVLKWRAEDSARANALWAALDALNQGLAKTLLRIAELARVDPAAYAKTVKYLSTIQSVQWLAYPHFDAGRQAITEAFQEVHMVSQDIRAKMREMGTLAGVPIEPPEQTELLDASLGGAGVIGGGVPGAGGYDALWLLVLDPQAVRADEERTSARVELLWGKWEKLRVSPLLCGESTEKGVRLEDEAGVPGLKELVDAPW